MLALFFQGCKEGSSYKCTCSPNKPVRQKSKLGIDAKARISAHNGHLPTSGFSSASFPGSTAQHINIFVKQHHCAKQHWSSGTLERGSSGLAFTFSTTRTPEIRTPSAIIMDNNLRPHGRLLQWRRSAVISYYMRLLPVECPRTSPRG